MYPIILRKVFCEPWAVMEDMHFTIQHTINDRMEGRTADIRAGELQVPFTPMAAGAGLRAPTERGSRLWTKGKLGVIPVRGVIGDHLSGLELMCGGYDVAQLCNDMEMAEEDPSLKRVMIDFHSPGGTVTGIPEAAKALAKLGATKETFGFTNGHSASASYWIMSQAQNIYMTESAQVGSIGVYLALLDKTESMKAKGEAVKIFKAGKHKAMGVAGTTLTAEEEAILQDKVDSTYADFTKAVRKGRDGVRTETMQGLMYKGQKAIEAKLADALVTSFNSLVAKLS